MKLLAVICFTLAPFCSTAPQTDPNTSTTLNAVSTTTTSTESVPPCEKNVTADFYDQRQNGTDNFRISVSNFSMVAVPLEFAFLGGFGDSDMKQHHHVKKECSGSNCQPQSRMKISPRFTSIMQLLRRGIMANELTPQEKKLG